MKPTIGEIYLLRNKKHKVYYLGLCYTLRSECTHKVICCVAADVGCNSIHLEEFAICGDLPLLFLLSSLCNLQFDKCDTVSPKSLSLILCYFNQEFLFFLC